MEQRNIIKWSEYSEYTELTIPSGEIWMSESELVDLFGVFIPKLRNTIKGLYKQKLVKSYEAERTIKKKDNLYVTIYNMEVVLLFHLTVFPSINHTARQCTTGLMLAQARVFPTSGKYRSLLGDFSSRTTELVLKIPQ